MQTNSTAEESHLRELSLSCVIRLIYSRARLSWAEVAARTRLNKSTVSSLVEDLLERGLLDQV